MIHRLVAPAVAAVLAATIGFGNVQPARADGAASTRNIILGAAALAAGIIISNNVAHKRELANTVAGYTSDGATVYADGRVAYPDGRSYYPNDNNQSIACRMNSCTIFNGDGSSGYQGYNRWNGSGWAQDGGYATAGSGASGYANAGPGYANAGPGYANAGPGYANGGVYTDRVEYSNAYNNYRETYRQQYNAYVAAYRDYLRDYDRYVQDYYASANREMQERVETRTRTVYPQPEYRVQTQYRVQQQCPPQTPCPMQTQYRTQPQYPVQTQRYAPPAPPRPPKPFCCDPNDNPATSGRHLDGEETN